MSSSNLFSRLTISPAHWLLFLFSNDAKLGMVISGKDVDDINLKSLYIAEYQIIKYHSKINLSGKSGNSWNVRIYHGLSEYAFHFFGEFLVAVTRKIGNGFFVLRPVIALVNIQ